MSALRSHVLYAQVAAAVAVAFPHSGARSVMRYKQLMHFVIEARDDREASDVAKKLSTLLKSPLVRMAIQGEGVQLAYGDGKPVVYAPTREA